MILGLVLSISCKSEGPRVASAGSRVNPTQRTVQSRRSAALQRAEELNARSVAEEERRRCQNQDLQLYKFNMDLQSGVVTASCGIPFVIIDAKELGPPLEGFDIVARTDHPTASGEDCPALFEKLETDMGRDGSVELHARNEEGDYRLLCRHASRQHEGLLHQ